MTDLKDKKLFLFDIDGTLAIGNSLYKGSRELLQYIDSIGGQSYFITNNSTHSNDDYVERFKNCFSLETVKKQFVTSGFMTVRFLKKHFLNKKIFVLGTISFIQELRRNGLHITETADDDISCIVAAYDSELTYQKLTETCRALALSNVPYYATNPDLCCPVDFGFIPDCGAICEMLKSATGKSPVYLGKPSKEVVELCLSFSGFSREETLVVGDRLYTDIACGINGGVDTCVVFTGEATPEEVQDTPYRPDYLFTDINELYLAISH